MKNKRDRPYPLDVSLPYRAAHSFMGSRDFSAKAMMG